MRVVYALFFSLFLISNGGLAYRFDAGSYYVGGGFGAQVNVARFNQPPRITPAAQMPLIAHVDYAVDNTWGVCASIVPTFSADSLGLSLRGGAKYWFNVFDGPLHPYASLELVPSLLTPFDTPNHFNLGISPGGGLQYFVLANVLVGAHVNFNPSLAFVDKEKRFEFSVMSYFDVLIKL